MIVAATAEAVAGAAERLRRGEVVAFPTETVYGLGADATNPEAVARVFAIKNRPHFDPLIVHAADATMARAVAAAWPQAADRLAGRFWPGPLTLVLPKRDVIPDLVTAGLPSVGLRVPDHPVAQALIAATGRPIAAPSANPFGYVSPTTADHVEGLLGDRVPLILDGGPCRVGLESTIIALLDPAPVLLRPGGVPLEEIERLLGAPVPRRPGAVSIAPGQLPRHYAPRTRITLVDAPDEVPPADRGRAAILLPRPLPGAEGFARVQALSDDGDPTAIAAALFAALRALDAAGLERIYAVRVAETGLGRAIMDRLRRGSAAADD